MAPGVECHSNVDDIDQLRNPSRYLLEDTAKLDLLAASRRVNAPALFYASLFLLFGSPANLGRD